MQSNRYAETSHKDHSFQWIVRYDEFRLVTCLFRKVQISISQSTDFHFVSFHFVSQSTISHHKAPAKMSDLPTLHILIKSKTLLDLNETCFGHRFFCISSAFIYSFIIKTVYFIMIIYHSTVYHIIGLYCTRL